MKNIKIENLCVSYDEILVLNNLNVELKAGTFNVILGKSGVGKTTFLRALFGFIDYEGHISGIHNMDISAVFQENRLLEKDSIIDNINFVQKENLDVDFIRREMNKIGLTCSPNKKIEELSGGMKRRVSILRSLLYQADLYILDEAFKELDKENYNLVLQYVKDKLKNKTVVLSTHNEDEVDFFKAKTIELK